MTRSGITCAVVWGLVLAPWVGHAAEDDSASREATVLIVGGGLTGLTTAYELNKVGIDSLILEASPRIGGKIYPYRGEGNRDEYLRGVCWH